MNRTSLKLFIVSLLLWSGAAGLVFASESQQKGSVTSSSVDAAVKSAYADTMMIRIPIGYRCNVKFGVSRDLIDPDYMDNRIQIGGIDALVAKIGLDRVDSVFVMGQSSPEGPESLNISLAKGRASALAKYLSGRYPRISGRIVSSASDEAFRTLREMLESDKQLSADVRTKIYTILDSPAGTAEKNARIQKYLGYRTYRYLVDKYYKHLRYTMVVVTHVGKIPLEFEEATDTATCSPFEIHYRRDSISVPLIPVRKTPEIRREYEYIPVLAAGTNALYDLVTAVNLNMQIPLGKHFSIGIDHVFPWWVSKDNSRALQILFPSVFARYWFKNKDKRVLTGLFAGVQAGGGKYDIEPAHKGYQGEFLTAMGELGYAWSLSRHWTLELSLGLGYFNTDYRYYEADETDRHLIYQYSGKYMLVSPTKANISFVYTLFHKRAKKGGAQ